MSLWSTLFCVWGPWEEVESGKFQNRLYGTQSGAYVIQKRTCKNCKKEELRTTVAKL